jgi:hypothetical protein
MVIFRRKKTCKISYLLSRVPGKRREKPENPKKTEKPEKTEKNGKTGKIGKSRKRREKGSQNIKACRIQGRSDGVSRVSNA